MNVFNQLIHFDIIDSTNDFIKDHSDELANYSVVVAKQQLKGRGQFERSWESDFGKNLLFSILFKDETPSETISRITVSTIIETLSHFGIEASFKLPNDVLVNRNKIAGMLIETKYIDDLRISLILGIGWNVNQLIFESVNATSMRFMTGLNYDLDEVLKVFLEKLEHNLL